MFEKFKYRFDNLIAKGTIALIGLLGLTSLVVVIIAGLFLSITGIKQEEGEALGFIEAMWQSLMRTMDAGGMAGDSGWTFRMVTLLVTIAGIFVFSALIGILNSGFESKIEELRKGKSRVLEKDHTLILGWSSKVFTIISELIVANSNKKDAVIVILSDLSKTEMEDRIREIFPSTGTTRIVCRTGNPIALNDLNIASPNEAKSIIVVSPECEDSDIYVIKTVLALTNNPKRKEEKYHIVAEIKDEENIEAANLVGNHETVYVLSNDLIAKVTAQTCRQSGASVIYTELLDFDGVEIYFKEESKLIGKTFKECLFMYNNASIIGILKQNGNTILNPAFETIIEKGDQIIAIAEDDDKIILSGLTDYKVNQSIIRNESPKKPLPEKTLVLGWNEKGTKIIKELDTYVETGSLTTVLTDDENMADEITALNDTIKKQKINLITGDFTKRAILNSLNIENFDHIIILSDKKVDIQKADAKTLVCLLHLRSISQQLNKNLSIVSEMLDINNKTLAEVTKADDFIVSDKITSLQITQLSENKHLKAVFDNIFDSEGSEIYLRAVSNYIKTNENTNFYTVLQSAVQKNEIAIGYRLNKNANNPEKGYGIVFNPPRDQILNFEENDKIIVISQN